MKKRMNIVIGALLVFALVVTVLLNNRSKMQAGAKNDVVKFLPVTLVPAQKEQLSESLTLTGTIAANNDVAVLSETDGRVTKVKADIGDRVKAGDVLVQVDDELKEAAYASAEVNYENTKKDLERYQKMSKEGSVSDAQLEGAKLAFKSAETQYIVARRQFNDTRIKTPISGIVTSRAVDVGTTLQKNNLVANVVDISTLKVKLNVAEDDVFKLRVGGSVEISTDVYPGVTFKGTIETISAKGDDQHTYPVQIRLANSDEHPLKAGMFARVAFNAANSGKVLAIPRETLLGSAKHAQVYVVDGGIARLRDLVVGAEVGTSLEVLSGLREGEQVVLSGQNNLKDNVAVTVVQ